MAKAAEAEKTGDKEPAKPGGLSFMSLVAAMVAAVVIAVAGTGGVVFWLAKSGRLPALGGSAKAESVKVEPLKTKYVPLDPLLVNLADEGGRTYLRVGVTLRVEEPPPEKGAKKEEAPKGPPKNENEAAMRDAALGVLGHETGAALLAPEGKEQLKAELKKAMTERVPEVKVVEVLLTEFLVQR